MRKITFVAAVVLGLSGAWIFATSQNDHKQKLADHPCINDYKKCRTLKELIDFYPPVNDARIQCIVAAEEDLKYGKPEWPSVLDGPKFGSHVNEGKLWHAGVITLVQQGALIPNAFGGKERRNMFCKYDLNTKDIVSFDVN